eukprot:CAMPEP_0206530198 /NCGR_PEP_ID=MMETSP0325_2-20121206/3026_1 /ASSEMBLY_ACC=CAM_ASM_000347 /TAXON_ID=2866 /ORGANISM="Crypthecodinium cohnii, Strain Seligo" /LENGTH=268 /DNA_ID=CAMNT_0054026203 /DNA_START=1 /DNA_END=807 /DNA_ORIENTATION=-
MEDRSWCQEHCAPAASRPRPQQGLVSLQQGFQKAELVRSVFRDRLLDQEQRACNDIDAIVNTAIVSLPERFRKMSIKQCLGQLSEGLAPNFSAKEALMKLASNAQKGLPSHSEALQRAERTRSVVHMHLRKQESKACQTVDALVQDATTHLPYSARKMPARAALGLLGGECWSNLPAQEALKSIHATLRELDYSKREALTKQIAALHAHLVRSRWLDKELSKTLRVLDHLSLEERLTRERRFKSHIQDLFRSAPFPSPHAGALICGGA